MLLKKKKKKKLFHVIVDKKGMGKSIEKGCAQI